MLRDCYTSTEVERKEYTRNENRVVLYNISQTLVSLLKIQASPQWILIE